MCIAGKYFLSFYLEERALHLIHTERENLNPFPWAGNATEKSSKFVNQSSPKPYHLGIWKGSQNIRLFSSLLLRLMTQKPQN